MKKNKGWLGGLKTWQLVVALVVVVGAGVLFALGISGVFDGGPSRVRIGGEYLCSGDSCTFVNVDAREYEELIAKKESFAIFVDQGRCSAAETLYEIVWEYMTKQNVRFVHISFDEMKDTSLYDYVKYYPSVAMVSEGRVVAFLKADSDEDAGSFNNYDDFSKWAEKYLEIRK